MGMEMGGRKEGKCFENGEIDWVGLGWVGLEEKNGMDLIGMG